MHKAPRGRPVRRPPAWPAGRVERARAPVGPHRSSGPRPRTGWGRS